MQPGHPVVGEVHDESLSFEASLHGGGQPPLVLYDKYPHTYSLTETGTCDSLPLSIPTASRIGERGHACPRYMAFFERAEVTLHFVGLGLPPSR
jgi:hypothetical protein